MMNFLNKKSIGIEHYLVLASYDSQVGATVFMVWVGKWSDGTLAPPIL